MKNIIKTSLCKKHLKITTPSPWVKRFCSLVPDGPVLDVAAGAGRHTKLFNKLGHVVTAIDKDISTLKLLQKENNIEVLSVNLEGKATIFTKGGPLYKRKFAGIVVVNYLHRPLMRHLLAALAPGGILIYETFAVGNELFSRPRNPDHLLSSGELIKLVSGKLQIIAFEQGIIKSAEIPGVKQRIVAAKDLKLSKRSDYEPEPHKIV